MQWKGSKAARIYINHDQKEVIRQRSWNLYSREWEIKGSRLITEAKVIRGGDEMWIMPSRSVSRSCLWTRQPANWNSIVGILGRSGSHLSSPLFNLTHRRAMPLSVPFQKPPPHGNNSSSSPFAPHVLPSPGAPFSPASEKSIPSRQHRLTWHLFTPLTLDLKATPDLLPRSRMASLWPCTL